MSNNSMPKEAVFRPGGMKCRIAAQARADSVEAPGPA